MFWHQLKIAFRIMIRQKFFTLLNLLGLAVGSACFLLIYSYVSDELSYDQFHQNKDQLYRINMTNIWIENNDIFGSTGPGVAGALHQDIPEAKHVVRIHTPYLGTKLIQVEDALQNVRSFEESGILGVDSSFFDVFAFPLTAGDPRTALNNPNSVVLSRNYAQKYFPEENALGKTISLGIGDQKQSMLVTAVAENVPDNSHFKFDILISMNSFPSVMDRNDAWIWTGFVTYAVLEDNSDLGEIKKKLLTLPAQYVGEAEAEQKNWELYLQKVTDIHLYSKNIPNRLGSVGSIEQVIIFSTVAILILLLSCVNFMNLSTARYAERAKEVGIQKVMGAPNVQLRWQFLTESFIFSFISVIIGFGIAELMRGWFNLISGKSVSIDIFQNPSIGLIMVILILVIGFISGSYPAWFLTRFKVVDVLKGRSSSFKTRTLRNALVVFQFTISIGLLGSSFLVKDQLNFLDTKPLGFNEENVLVIPHMEWMQDNGHTFRQMVERNNHNILSASVSNQVPPNIWYQEKMMPLNAENFEDLAVSTLIADQYYASTLGLSLVSGRNFFQEGEGDQQSILINEKCAIQMGWILPGDDPETVLGRKVALYGEEGPQFTVIGVLKDFNFWDLTIPVEPLAIFHPKAPMWKGDQSFLMVKLNPAAGIAEYEDIIANIQSTWVSMLPNLPFDPFFLNQKFDAAFEVQRKFGKVIDSFTLIAILIAVLGLVGLISFTTEQRTKEFSIRKVLGATIPQLIRLITLDFFKLLGIGFVVGSGICFYYGNEWLNNFAYRTNISPMIFVLSGITLFSIITVISIIIVQRNANKNPAITLRDE